MSAFGKRTEIVPAPPQEPGPEQLSEHPPEDRPCVNVKPEQELRGSIRNRTFKAGVISYDDHHFTIACTIRNISETGARLQILEKLIVPDTFVLLIELDSIETDCEAVWRHSDAIGVKFVSPMRPVKQARTQVVGESNPNPDHPLRRHPVR